MRRIVQDPRFFFKIRPGLWALKGWETRLPADVLEQAQGSPAREAESAHSYYQGLLVEIGNLKHFRTFVPRQDKNKKFLTRPLGEVATLEQIYPFTYERLLRRAQTIDVTWFNDREMPDTFFEVEYSTDIYNSLLKFVDLQDFNSQFRIVADASRRPEFASRLGQTAFGSIASRVRFVDYQAVSELHARAHALALAESRW